MIFFIEEVKDNLILSVPFETVGDLITFKKKPAFSKLFLVSNTFFFIFYNHWNNLRLSVSSIDI